ncbi:hypothetical protein BaRGS_00034215, partial [Batillaria attramentaria]
MDSRYNYKYCEVGKRQRFAKLYASVFSVHMKYLAVPFCNDCCKPLIGKARSGSEDRRLGSMLLIDQTYAWSTDDEFCHLTTHRWYLE